MAAAIGAAVVNAAAASPSSMQASAGSAFCTKFAKPIFGHGTNLFKLSPAKLKADDAVFKKDQPGALAAAPGSIRTDLKKLFAFDNMLFTDVSKVGWKISRLSHKTLEKLAIEGPKLKPASDKVVGYLDAHCGMHLVKP
ncbi:MAG TPA: hypothetical protein VGH46_12690 [Gaiellaceae bacterium]